MVEHAATFGQRSEKSAAKAQLSARAYADLLDRAGIETAPQQLFLMAAGAALLFWIVLVLFTRPGAILSGVLLAFCGGAVTVGLRVLIKIKLHKRLDLFVTQLEMALRLIASGVRIGLSLRQALAMVIEEMPNPARHEYMRVIGETNIGVSVYDALDHLARRMPGNETLMMARAIRIQSQTGGDLAKILEHLAGTIKERRRIQRKIRALTAEGRATAGILTGLPPFLACFISLTQQQMGHSLLFTNPGHIALGIVAVLESGGLIWLAKLLKVEV
jgi:tight adherence protein B